jgi:cell division protein FtsL
MIQAQSYARSAGNLDTAESGAGVVRVKRTYTRVNSLRIFCIKTGIFLFGYALLLVFLCTKSAALGYQIVALQKDIHNLETDNKRVEYQIASQTSLQRVEAKAVKDLGMYKPDASSMFMVAEQPDPVVKAKPSRSDSPQQPAAGENTLQKVYKTIAVMAR